MQKSRKPEEFIRFPGYPGGKEALGQFIRQNLRYPKEAQERGIEGIVIVEFEYNINGEVLRTKVKKGLGYGCDEEAERIVKKLQFERVKQRKLRVTYRSTINIKFALPKKVQVQKGVTYTITPSQKKQDSPSKPSSFGYSIRLPKT